MPKTWTVGAAADMLFVPATPTYRGASTTAWVKHTPPLQAANVTITNRSATTAYVSMGIPETATLVDAGIRAAGEGHALATGDSVALPFTDRHGSRIRETAAETPFYTVGDDLEIYFGGR